MPSNQEKWNISIFSAVLFLLVVHPYTYGLVDSLLRNIIGPIANNGCPTTLGLIIHTIVFILVVRYSMDLDIV